MVHPQMETSKFLDHFFTHSTADIIFPMAWMKSAISNMTQLPDPNRMSQVDIKRRGRPKYMAVSFCNNHNSVHVFKLRLGALIPRSVGWLVGLLVCWSSKNYKKNYKTLQNITKRHKTLTNH